MKKMWVVLAGNVPVCIKKGEIFPITAFINQRKNIFIPIFDDFHKAKTLFIESEFVICFLQQTLEL